MLRSLLALATLMGCSEESVVAPSAPPGVPQGFTEIEWGEALFLSQGCTGCHHINGLPGVGGALDRIGGTERTFVDGTRVVVDDDYIRESILFPDARAVEGSTTRMPAYASLLDEPEVDALVAYISSLQ